MLISRRCLVQVGALWSSIAAIRRTPFTPGAQAAARRTDQPPLTLVAQGKAYAPIVTDFGAGPWESRAAKDLAFYIEKMTGAKPPLVSRVPPSGPALLVGAAALQQDMAIGADLDRIKKANPVVQADAILIRRAGDRLYIAGSNDESHYFAASWLLQHCGCRWYMPGDFGEHVPRHEVLSIGSLDHLYAPPFEIRHYWLSWNGDSIGADAFRHRNYMSAATIPGAGHALDQYTAALAPPGGSHFDVAFADPATAEHVANGIEAEYAAGKDISLAIAEGVYSSRDPRDQALITEYDPFMLRPSVTDAMLTLYNAVARILSRRHPASPAKIGGLAYANATLPPKTITRLAPNLVMWIAPIDIDPSHAVDDARSPPRRAYGDMVRNWAAVTNGRLAVYDYDQGMLVWRDLPNPSHSVFAHDVKHYRNAGILGIGTESRGAFATTFLNLFFRGQLMWNPDADVGALLERFYDDFYGAAAAPMRRYWSAIFSAWDATRVTEHEYPAIPAIYTSDLVQALGRELRRAEALAIGQSELIATRMKFTRLSFEIIEKYTAMVTASARRADYSAAVAAGEQAIAARLELAQLNPIFTVRVVGAEAETAAGGAAWLEGEVQQYRELAQLTGGGRGRLAVKLPLVWSFRRGDSVAPGWRYEGPAGPELPSDPHFATERPTERRGWIKVRSDLYLQAQGVHAENPVSALGSYWYQSTIQLNGEQAAEAHRLMFPGLFNEAWLFINGRLVAHRPFREPWWQSDYRFEWDVEISGRLQVGRNVIALRGFNPHHFAGVFRRPFLYAPVPEKSG
ncbi:MAG TPA: DUF4838 domain-containing protein [Allosphingosinicella sp.]|nr:DUF4838 domain-containing protein [Allosphingosinicella sp.]